MLSELAKALLACILLMRLLAPLIFLFASAQAFAQTSALTLTFTAGGTALSVNASSCTSTESITWAAQTPTVACTNPLVIWATTGACGTTGPTGSDVTIQSIATWQGQTGTAGVVVGNLPIFNSTFDGGVAVSCGTTPAFPDQAVQICASPVNCTSSTVASITLTFDNVPPQAPSVAISPLDGALGVGVTPNAADNDVAQVQVQYRPATDGGQVSFIQEAPVAVNASIAINGLQDGTTYEVQAQVSDAAGNLSPWSPSGLGTPVHTNGFFDNYKNSGGADRGGCAAAGGGLGAGALVLAGWFLSRRRRR
jgi:hypothetical protein